MAVELLVAFDFLDELVEARAAPSALGVEMAVALTAGSSGLT